MICPNCGKEMKSIDRLYVGFGDEPDYDLYEHFYRFVYRFAFNYVFDRSRQ